MTQADALDDLLGAPTRFDAIEVAALRRRRSYKWTAYPADVLPAFVAEMDLPLAPAVTAALLEAVETGDAGYANDLGAAETFAAFAEARWSWTPDPGRVAVVPDVMGGVARAIEILTNPGDGVVLTPPVYGPFRQAIERLGRAPVDAPMRYLPGEPGRWALDVDAIGTALDAGARAILLCNPHNPTGSIPTPAELAALRDAAARTGAGLISDEVHAPLTLPGRTFTPLLALGEQRALTVTSASKSWNVAGLKCALLLAGDRDTADAVARLPVALRHPGHHGVLAANAAFAASTGGDAWLEDVTAHLARQHDRARALLAEALPPIRVTPADAGYLMWLDCRGLDLAPAANGSTDPAEVFLERGRVALSPGPDFGREGAGFARLNIGTSGPLLLDAVRRMRAAAS
ncbi:MAG TPA: aminotransferase class I/II-fold pyridoxal phosphate-dependent enzyme [Frankiaceae bacterium]|nr:aminotransferase class I/II-fold pyridoxal phosphate-dependent enzyme [Frankiaceae bacterium]